MSKKDVVGHSKTTTPIKQANFRDITSFLLDFYKREQAYNQLIYPNFVYIETNAGPGIHPDYGEGSPIIFLKQAQEKAIRYRSILFEQSVDEANNLRRNVLNLNEGFVDEDTQVINASNNILTQQLIKSYIKIHHTYIIKGLMYADPNGYDSFEQLIRFSHMNSFSEMDVLISCPCNGIKLSNTCKTRRWEHKIASTLQDYLSSIKRNYWFVREPVERLQWSLIFGTNNQDLNIPSLSVLHNVNSNKGKDIFKQLNYTKEEISLGLPNTI